MLDLLVAQEIKNWKGKPKELVTSITEKITQEPFAVSQVIELLKAGSKLERGTSADIIEALSKTKPEILAPYLDTLIAYINDKLPKVKWGTQETIGNLSVKYPIETQKAIPNLLLNTKDPSTVVKWCAAFAISEIAKNSPSSRATLVPKMQEIAKNETNNGVKNVYLKALKKIGK